MESRKITGLRSADISELNHRYGKNVLSIKKEKSFIKEFLKEFKDLMVMILLGAALISLAAGDYKDTVVITAVLLINAGIGFTQKYKAEKAVEALQKMLAPQARVLRDDKERMIPASDLVPGDILILSEGDRVGADAIVLEEYEAEVQEAILTGESIPIKKMEGHMIYMGTVITHGNAKAKVQNIGMETKFGKIAKLTSETTKDATPLQKELNRISVFVGKMTLIAAGFLVLVGVFLQEKPIVQSILFAASVAVAAVPEGLPATISIALSFGVKKLAAKKAIIKELASVETLGATTVIVSDKTGTLTKNEMEVKELFMIGHHIQFSEAKYTAEKDILEGLSLIACNSALCNNAKNDETEFVGDPTEIALLKLPIKIGFPSRVIEKSFKKLHEFPFDSKRKRMSVIVEKHENQNQYLFTKGAPDSVLQVCTHVYENGEINEITDEYRKIIQEKNDLMAGSALRVIAFAYKKIEYPKGEVSEEKLIFMGLAGMIDPPRQEVPNAIQAAYKAGIRIYIVTGDHGLTAAAIGKMIGLINDEEPYKIITGAELEKIPEKELTKKLASKEKIIFARVSPEDKLRIVNALKSLDEIVAVTGDGVNDAPALKRADIGIAMGITGTDVSKEAANMILTDDSFATIVNAIEEGRAIYQNMKKFLMYIFSSNIGEIIVIIGAIILGMESPFSAITILMINLGTDVFQALALGTDRSIDDLMKKKPRHHSDHVLSTPFIKRMVFLGSLVGGTSLMSYVIGLRYYTQQEAAGLAFAVLMIGQIANTYNARSSTTSALKDIGGNIALLGISVFCILLTIVMTQIPKMEAIFQLSLPDKNAWSYAVLAGCIVLAAEEMRKWVMRRNSVKISNHSI